MVNKKVENDVIPGRTFFTNPSKHIVRDFNPRKSQENVTIYYLDYKSEIRVIDSNSHTINFIIDEQIYKDAFERIDGITINGIKNDRTQFIQSVILRKTNQGIIEILVDDTTYNLPSQFRYYDPSAYSKFTFVVTLTYDILLIHCFAVLRIDNRNVCFTVRYHLPKILKTKKTDIITTIKDNIPMMDNLFQKRELMNVFNVTCIPNYAKLAQRLGFSFNIF